MELLILSVVAFFSILIILKSATYLILSVSSYARKTGISNYLIGFFVVSIGTSLPEISTSVMAGLSNNGELILGDVLGANTIVVTLVMGAFLLVARSIFIKDLTIKETIMNILLLASLPLLLGVDGMLSRIDGIILIVAFGIYLSSLFMKESDTGELKKDVKFKKIIVDQVTFLLALGALLLAAQMLVWSVSNIAVALSIPSFIMGSVFLAVATTLPELTVTIKSVVSKKMGIAFGNTFGSVVINSTLVLGVGAIIHPIEIARVSHFLISAFIMLGCIIVSYFVIIRQKLDWRHGLFLIVFYMVFLVVQILL